MDYAKASFPVKVSVKTAKLVQLRIDFLVFDSWVIEWKSGRTPTWKYQGATGGMRVLQRDAGGCGKATPQAVCKSRLGFGCPAQSGCKSEGELGRPRTGHA